MWSKVKGGKSGVQIPLDARKPPFISMEFSVKNRGQNGPETLDTVGFVPTVSIVFGLDGGGGGSRTPVRKHFFRNLSGRRRLFEFPRRGANRHASRSGSFICHAGGKAYPGHVHHLDHAQARLVVLPGWTAALSSGENVFVVVL